MVECPWCKFNPGCGGKMSDCDLRTLPYEKDKIIERVIFENNLVEKLKAEVLQDRLQYVVQEKSLAQAMDKMAGINIMTARLKEDFKMSDDEIRKACGLKSPSLMQKAKLVMVLQQMKMSRRQK